MDTAEEVLIMAAADRVRDNRDHAHHLLVEGMADLVADLVAHHHLDPLQVDLEEEEDMEEHLLRV